MCPLTNLRGEKPPFLRIFGPKLTLWAPPFPNALKIRKSKNNSVSLWLCEQYWACPYQTWWGSPTHLWDQLSPWCGGGAGKFWIDISSAVWQLVTRCLILWVGFRGQAIQWRHSRARGSKGRCHGNQFWERISCKWTLSEDSDMRLSCKGWFVFSQPLRLLVALSGFVVVGIGTAPGDCQVGNWHVNCQHSSLSCFLFELLLMKLTVFTRW